MNTTTRQTLLVGIAEEQPPLRPAIVLRVGVGPKRTTPGYDDSDEAGDALFATLAGLDIPDPTLIARAREITALWTFDAPVREDDLITLTQALGRALDTSPLRGWAISTGRVSERDRVSERAFRGALGEFLPSAYSRG